MNLSYPSTSDVETAVSSGTVKPLILNLYDETQGYTVTLPGKNCKDAVTRNFQYAESDLLDCLERGEVPHFLADILELCPGGPVYVQGCVPVRVKDHRYSNPAREDLIVLRPSAQSLIADLNGLLWVNREWSVEKKLELEENFWRLVSPTFSHNAPTCSQRDSYAFDSIAARKLLKKTRQSRVERRRKEHEVYLKTHPTAAVMRFLSEDEQGSSTSSQISAQRLVVLAKCSTWKAPAPSTPLPQGGGQWRPMVSCKRAFDVAAKRWSGRDKSSPEHQYETLLRRMDEYTVDVQMPSDGQNAPVPVQSSRILICKHARDGSYWGHLHLECPPISSGPFHLGKESEAKAYVYQFLDMFTESGRKPVSVTRYTPGKPPQQIVSPPKVAK